MLVFVAAVDFDLPNACRVLDDHSAAVPPAILKGDERTFDVGRPLQLLRQHQRILDPDTRASRQVRCRGMDGVADEHDAAAEPWLRHEQTVDWSENDLRLSLQLRPHALQHRIREAGEQRPHPRGELLRRDVFAAGRPRLGDEDVHFGL